jgi:hypothetical protein
MFRITTRSVGRLYDSFTQDVTGETLRMRALGMDASTIYERLLTNLNDGKDLFGRFKGQLESELDQLVGISAQESSNTIYGKDQMLRWELDPTVIDHCEDCVNNSEMEPQLYEDWESIGLPGFGNTQCGDYCKCTLVIDEQT